MKTILIILFFLVAVPAWAGMNFSSLKKDFSSGEYVKSVAEYKQKSISDLKDILQQVGSPSAVVDKLSKMRTELNALAIRAGQTTDEDMIDLQTRLEDKIRDHLSKILDYYAKGPDKKYFDEVASAITDLKSFRVPYSAGGVDVIDNSSPGADIHFYSRPFLKANFTHR